MKSFAKVKHNPLFYDSIFTPDNLDISKDTDTLILIV